MKLFTIVDCIEVGKVFTLCENLAYLLHQNKLHVRTMRHFIRVNHHRQLKQCSCILYTDHKLGMPKKTVHYTAIKHLKIYSVMILVIPTGSSCTAKNVDMISCNVKRLMCPPVCTFNTRNIINKETRNRRASHVEWCDVWRIWILISITRNYAN